MRRCGQMVRALDYGSEGRWKITGRSRARIYDGPSGDWKTLSTKQ